MKSRRSWLILSMQMPAQPAYPRVKIWRQLREAGALSIAGGAHLLPDTSQTRATFQSAVKKAIAGGGQAVLLSGSVVDGAQDLEALFRSARTADYEEWIRDVDALIVSEVRATDVTRMRRRLDQVRASEFIETGLFKRASDLLKALVASSQRHPDVGRATPGQAFRSRELHGRVWVTRRSMGIDRIASAWLIQRFIDPRPRFRFVDPDRYVHARRELRFDMADGEFTHEGGNCSFETLLARANVEMDTGLSEIAMLVHKLDIEDDKFDPPATEEFAEAIATICAESNTDEERLQSGSELLDALHGKLVVDDIV
jgi:hypothetical protein